MDLLEVPLEAVALRLYSLPGGSVWAWTAVVAAALGLWGIRAVGSRPEASPVEPSPPPPVAAVPVERAEQQQQAAPADRRDCGPVPMRPSGCHEEETSSTKVRFTAYYHVASCDGCGAADEGEYEEEEEGGVRGVECRATALWSGGWWREELRVRWRGDLGWYRYQDMTALDGSVVRLWDGADAGELTAVTRRRQRRQMLL